MTDFTRHARRSRKLLKFPGLPSTLDDLKTSETAFKTSRSPPNPLSGCVGVLDGISVKIQKPPNELNPAAFFYRKGNYSIPVQALVNSDCLFLSFSAKCVGSAHDSFALSVSRIGKVLSAKRLRKEFWIAGDEAYVCTEILIILFRPRKQENGRVPSNSFIHLFACM